MKQNRRKFIQNTFQSSLGLALLSPFMKNDFNSISPINEDKIKLSLQCFSFGMSLMRGKLSILDFPKLVREEFNLGAAEYWNIPLLQKRNDKVFIKELKTKTADYGLQNTLMLVDLINFRTGKSLSLCSADSKERNLAVDGHKEWIDTAKSIGCKAIRANLWSEGMKADEVKEISQESLGLLLEYSSSMGMDIVIENHGGFTSDARWVVELMKIINHPNLGTLPDFGTNNFCIERAPKKEGQIRYTSECINQYDKYKGVEEMLPYAKGISAKSVSFNAEGEENNTDFKRMIELIQSSGFEGYMAIEYEGGVMSMLGGDSADHLSPKEGIIATKKLIEKYL